MNKKYLITGFGQVAESFLRLSLEQNKLQPGQIYVIDKDAIALERFSAIVGFKEHFLQAVLGPPSEELLGFLQPGDFIIDLAEDVTNTEYCQYALAHGLHYISTADSTEKGFELDTLHKAMKTYISMAGKAPAAATCIVQFGMNPGLVSPLAKKAFRDMVQQSDNGYIAAHREDLQALLQQKNYAQLCQQLGVEQLHISDIDTTNTIPLSDQNTVYSTWNVNSFKGECLAYATMLLGSWEKLDKWRTRMNAYLPDCGAVFLDQPALTYNIKTYGPEGFFLGHPVAHEEIFSLNRILSTYEDDKLVYRPRIAFIYKPCSAAEQSLMRFLTEAIKTERIPGYDNRLLQREDAISGGEAVGVYLTSKRAGAWYTGYNLQLHDTPWGLPTTYQVALGVYASLCYCHQYPREGVRLPEMLREETIFAYLAKLAVFESHMAPQRY